MKRCVSPACGSRKHDLGAKTCWWCEARLVGEDAPAVPLYGDNADVFVGDGPLTATNYAFSDKFTHLGFDIHWEDYRPAYIAGELRGEWVAESQTGYTAIRLPALVNHLASVDKRLKEKAATLQKLFGLIDGSNS